MKTIIFIAIIATIALPIFADEALEPKKQDKRGVLGLGYGGYYSGLGYPGVGYPGSLGYGGLASPLVNHGVLPSAYSHAPLVGAGYHGSYYNSPLRFGYNGLGYNGLGHGLGFGHGLNYNYLNGGHIY